jgi:hypothetical protein
MHVTNLASWKSANMHRTIDPTRKVAPFLRELSCGDWSAWHDFMPARPPTLYVVGLCTFPTPGYTVVLKRAFPPGLNPAILILDRVVIPPATPQPARVDLVDVRFAERTSAEYDQVYIRPDQVLLGVQVVR